MTGVPFFLYFIDVFVINLLSMVLCNQGFLNFFNGPPSTDMLSTVCFCIETFNTNENSPNCKTTYQNRRLKSGITLTEKLITAKAKKPRMDLGFLAITRT